MSLWSGKVRKSIIAVNPESLFFYQFRGKIPVIKDIKIF